MAAGAGLSAEQRAFYDSQGFLLVEGFASVAECKALMEHVKDLIEGFEDNEKSIFSTKNQKEKTGKYFFESANNISYFYEEKAHDENGSLKQPRALSINKIGHALHDLDPVFREFSRSAKVATMLTSLGYRAPVPIQSMYIFKQPGIGGEVVPHQDSSFLYTEPPSCMGLWVALEDATVENGCIWVLPGSHRDGLARRFVKTEQGVTFKGEAPQYDMTKFIPVEVKAGSLMLLHGALVHTSYENKSPKSRHAYSVHIVESNNCTYAAENWLHRRPDFPLEALYNSSSESAPALPSVA
eukprot:SM000035S13107  [mRNA]  locus=s35:389112:391869:- [translate_table: standard]